MQIKSVFYLFIFLGVLFTPLCIRYIDTNNDITAVESMGEEENSENITIETEKFTSEISTNFKYSNFKRKTIHIPLSSIPLLWDTVHLNTSSPPPKIVV